MSALTIAGVELRRFLRDRSNIFFVFIFPLLLVVLIGSQFGGDGPQGRVVVAGEAGELRSALVEVLEGDGVAVTLAEPDAARELLARGRSDAGVFVPAGAALGEPVTVEVVTGPQAGSQVALERVRTAVRAVGVSDAQLAALTGAGVAEVDARAALEDAAGRVSPPTLSVVDVDAVAQELSGLGQFDLGASSQLLLFVFLISVAGSATLIQARRYGVVRRTLAAPVTTGGVVRGQALGRFAIAGVQGLYIMAGTALVFGVDWGTVWLSVLVLALFAAVAAAAAMVIGSVMDNDAAASGVGVGSGLILGALGGAMTPLEFFPDALRTAAHITPHAWGYDAFAKIQRHDATLSDIALELGVLAAMAVVLLLIGSWALRRSLARAM